MLFTGRSNDALEAANAFLGAAIVAVHNEGYILRKSGAELSASFIPLGVAFRLTPLERGQPTRFEL